MLYALNITNPEDEVIVPNFTMIATPNAVKLA
jgi:dTDP-4-amino-4,6-dideoxygalactose transaminase